MRKYLLGSLVLLSFAAFAKPASLGQQGADSGEPSQRDCNRPEIQGCGPCFKLCMQQNSGERGGSKTGSSSKEATVRGATKSATGQ